MIIAITGARGFLGKYLLNKVRETQHVVYALTSKPNEIVSEGKVIPIHKDKYIDVPWEEIDVLINCAFPRNTDGIMMADGLRYIQNVLLFAVEQGVKSVINISSQSVYSQKRKEAASSTSINPKYCSAPTIFKSFPSMACLTNLFTNRCSNSGPIKLANRILV